jgi:hypothetical protein
MVFKTDLGQQVKGFYFGKGAVEIDYDVLS